MLSHHCPAGAKDGEIFDRKFPFSCSAASVEFVYLLHPLHLFKPAAHCICLPTAVGATSRTAKGCKSRDTTRKDAAAGEKNGGLPRQSERTNCSVPLPGKGEKWRTCDTKGHWDRDRR